jgi:hypothetical protein
MTTITVRVSGDELSYLNALATNKKLFKGAKDVSLGNVLKTLLQWCCENQVDPSPSSPPKHDEAQKILEQVHVVIPHLLYLSRLHLLMNGSSVPDEVVARCKEKAIDYINTVCGDFQGVSYREIKPSKNDIGLEQMPLESELSQWGIK